MLRLHNQANNPDHISPQKLRLHNALPCLWNRTDSNIHIFIEMNLKTQNSS